jgi:hypothetical protein
VKKATRKKAAAGKKTRAAAKSKPAKATKATKKAKKAAAAPASKRAPAKGKSARAAKKGKAKPVVIPPDAHPRLGVKHTCFGCGAKFYDLFRPEPTCPKCGADQRDAPPVEPKAKAAPKPKRVRKAAMSPLLDDDDDEAVIDDDAAPSLDLGDAGADFDDPTDIAPDDDLDP